LCSPACVGGQIPSSDNQARFESIRPFFPSPFYKVSLNKIQEALIIFDLRFTKVDMIYY
jgi:hypothetical protein